MSAAEPRRIVHIIGALVAGGAERFVVDLVRALKIAGHEVSILTLSERTDAAGQQFAEQLRDASVPFSSSPCLKVRVRAVMWLRHQLRRAAPSVVHLHTPNSELAHLLAFPGRRPPHSLVRTIHNTHMLLSPATRLALRANPVASTIFCSSAACDANISRVRGNAVTIPYGVRFDWPLRTPEVSRREKTALGIDATKTHFLAVGRQDGRSMGESAKAHDVLIGAWRAARLGERGGVLHVLGTGNLHGRLRDLAKGDATIRLHGATSEVHRWLVACDCFVMPSRWEGLPLAAIEAVGTGLPCILTSIPPLRELDPPLASWVPVDDLSALGEALTRFLDNPRAPASSEAIRARERFDIEKAARRYSDVYQHVLQAT